MPLHRRDLLALTAGGVLAGLAGCSVLGAEGDGHLVVSSAHPEPQTLDVSIAPDYDADPIFSETIQVGGPDERVEREAVVSGSDGDRFVVEVTREPTEETVETVWEFDCVGDSDRADRLDLSVTEWGTCTSPRTGVRRASRTHPLTPGEDTRDRNVLSGAVAYC